MTPRPPADSPPMHLEPQKPALPSVDAMFDSLSSTIAQQPPQGYFASLRTPIRYTLALVLAFGISGATLVLGLRPDMHAYPAWWMALSVAFYSGLLMWLVELNLRPCYRPSAPPRLVQTSALGAFALITVLAALPFGTNFLPAGTRADLNCLTVGTMAGGLLFVLLRLLDRGRTEGPWLAAGAGGLLGNTMLQLHCHADGTAHRLLGHAGVGGMLLVAAAVVWACRRQHRN